MDLSQRGLKETLTDPDVRTMRIIQLELATLPSKDGVLDELQQRFIRS